MQLCKKIDGIEFLFIGDSSAMEVFRNLIVFYEQAGLNLCLKDTEKVDLETKQLGRVVLNKTTQENTFDVELRSFGI